MSVTLTGCVDFVTGEVKITDSFCLWPGCMIWSGTHAGQVALSPNTADCPDTYYGCVNFPGGTFSVVVPESCCPCTPFGCCGCWGCDDVTTKPTEMALTLSGIDDCDGLPGSSLNGEHILEIDDSKCDCDQTGICTFDKRTDDIIITVTMNLDGDVSVSGSTADPDNPGSFNQAFRFRVFQSPPDTQAGCIIFKSGSGDNEITTCTPSSGLSGFGGSTSWSTSEIEAICDG